METFLIVLLIAILFMERGGKVRSELLIVARTNMRGFLKYFGSAAVLSLTLSSLPGIWLSCYMRSNDFFAYEVFGSQQHAIQVLSLNVFLNFLILSAYMFGMALLWGAKADKYSVGVGAIVSLAVVVVLITSAVSSGRYDLGIAVLLLCLVLGGYLYFWVSSGFNEKAKLWWIPLVFSMVFVFGSAVGYRGVVILTENALFQMKVGGINVELSEPLGFANQKSLPAISAKLLLRTPEFYYLRLNDDPEHVVILSTEHVSLRYKIK